MCTCNILWHPRSVPCRVILGESSDLVKNWGCSHPVLICSKCDPISTLAWGGGGWLQPPSPSPIPVPMQAQLCPTKRQVTVSLCLHCLSAAFTSCTTWSASIPKPSCRNIRRTIPSELTSTRAYSGLLSAIRSSKGYCVSNCCK